MGQWLKKKIVWSKNLLTDQLNFPRTYPNPHHCIKKLITITDDILNKMISRRTSFLLQNAALLSYIWVCEYNEFHLIETLFQMWQLFLLNIFIKKKKNMNVATKVIPHIFFCWPVRWWECRFYLNGIRTESIHP